MAGTLALGSNLTSNSSNSATEQIATAYKATQKYRLDAIQKKAESVMAKQKMYNNLNSKMNVLVSSVDVLSASTAADKFKAKKVTSSNALVATATASGDAVIGVSTIKVNKLAVNDRLISDRVTLADPFGMPAGETKFDITVNGVTKNVSVTFDGTETTDTALGKVTKAINLVTDMGASASYVKDTSKTGRFVLTSSNTGSDYKISFSDNPVFAKFGLTNANVNPSETRTLATSTKAGYSNANSSDLDAKAVLNGIDVVSSSNTLDNVLSGVKITLLKAQDTGEGEVNLTTDTDVQSVKDFINPILSSFNDILNLSNSDKNVKRNDSAINTLSTIMRALPSQKVSTVTPGNYEYLGNIGIKADKNGNLSVSDLDLFTKTLKEDANKVIELFTSADGFVTKLNNAISNMKGDNGLIKSRTLSLSTEANTLNDKYSAASDQIDRQAAAVKKQYEASLKTYLTAQSQYSSFSSLSAAAASGTTLG